jgi:hypothetical protein
MGLLKALFGGPKEVDATALRADEIKVGMTLAGGKDQYDLLTHVHNRGETVTKVDTDQAGYVYVQGDLPGWAWTLPPDYYVYVKPAASTRS